MSADNCKTWDQCAWPTRCISNGHCGNNPSTHPAIQPPARASVAPAAPEGVKLTDVAIVFEASKIPALNHADVFALVQFARAIERAALSGSAGGETATPADLKDAQRWRQWRKGNPLTVKVPHPDKPGKFVTVIYGPNREPGYGDSLDAAIDAAMGLAVDAPAAAPAGDKP